MSMAQTERVSIARAQRQLVAVRVCALTELVTNATSWLVDPPCEHDRYTA